VASPTEIKIDGLKEFRKALKQAGDEFPKELRAANLEAAQVVATEAKRRAPKGPHEGTPRGARFLAAAESVRALATQRRGQVAIGGARAPHAQVLEFGGQIPRRGSNKSLIAKARAGHRSFAETGVTSLTRVRKQAFLYPALDAKADEVVEVYAAALDRLTKRAFPR
jgi:hypothetical protein